LFSRLPENEKRLIGYIGQVQWFIDGCYRPTAIANITDIGLITFLYISVLFTVFYCFIVLYGFAASA